MSYELLYTSAARGLRPGSQGFCVVVSTQGLSANLADRLESLSGYRHVFAAQDAQAALNPTVWSHLRLSVAGRTYHVLSRIAASGLDYTQRSNKIAHHVALESSELIPAGPAALLSAPGFMAAEWDGQARLLPEGRRTPPVTAAPAVCRAWQAATGDAGWGGVLAESSLGSTVRPALLIYNPGTDVLNLIAEALALLPPERRWQVTFSSYYTRLPAGVDCQWRGLVAGSPEALSARHVPGALVIDLARPLGAAQGGALVAAARTGRMVAEAKPSPAPVARALPAVEDAAYSIDDDHARSGVAAMRRPTHSPLADTGIELGPPPQYGTDLWEPPLTRTLTPKPQPRWPLWLAAGVGALLCVALGVAGWVRMRSISAVAHGPRALPSAGPESTHPARVEPPPIGSVDRPPKIAKLPQSPTEPIEPDPHAVSPDSSDPDAAGPESPDSLEPSVFDSVSTPAEMPAEPKARVSLDSIPAFVELPPIGGAPAQALFSLPQPAIDYVLKLRGPRMADGAQLALKGYEPGRYWVLAEFASATGGSERIAHLEERDGSLEFRWEPLKNADQRLRWRELKNQVLLVRTQDAGERAVALRKPEHAQPLTLVFSGKPAESSWDVDTPPGGTYTPLVKVAGNLSLASREQSLSVNLRSEPVATPVKMTVEVLPPKVFGKHMLQSKLKGTLRLTYRGVQIAREHLKADDPQALQPTLEPEPITPEALRSYMNSLGQQIRSDVEKLKALGPPPASPPPPGSGPPRTNSPPPGSGPPADANSQERRQLMQSIRRGNEQMRQAQALNRLFSVLQSARFDFQVSCDVDGYPICVVSTSEPAAPLVTSASGP